VRQQLKLLHLQLLLEDHDETRLEAETHEVQDEELLEQEETDEVDQDESHELSLSTIRKSSIFDE
jgi:hypothetical protein